MGLLDPLVTFDGIDGDPLHVIVVVGFGMGVGILGVLLRRSLMAAADELADLWREYSPIATHKALERRTMPVSPWVCDRCRSMNGVAAAVCYACGARREAAEISMDGVEAPAGPGAGRAQRR